jgi:hypothetical protein
MGMVHDKADGNENGEMRNRRPYRLQYVVNLMWLATKIAEFGR